MHNYVLRNRTALSENNYITKADPTLDYWFNFAYSKLQNYIADYGEHFNVVIAGSDQAEYDFFVIPFRTLKSVFTKEYLSNGSRGQTRWIGSITDGQLRIRNYPDLIDIARFYGDLSRL